MGLVFCPTSWKNLQALSVSFFTANFAVAGKLLKYNFAIQNHNRLDFDSLAISKSSVDHFFVYPILSPHNFCQEYSRGYPL